MPVNCLTQLNKNNDSDADQHTQQSIKVEFALVLDQIKNCVWLIGIPSWLFAITDRSVAIFYDGNLSPIDILQLLMTCLFFVSWLYLKPEESLNSNDVEPNEYEEYLSRSQAHKFRLKKRHMISQDYILPFPYYCQIYHLLNLKHLETVHKFSLNSLKILSISQFQPTNIGGVIKFTTMLQPNINLLRFWRQPIVEVDLILHTPYTIELSIPAYNDKRIVVIFHAFPLSEREHQLFIDIYSDLEWPKPILQFILHCAACLTLFEDLPYLQALAEKNVERLFNVNLASKQETMLLFKRFIELYGIRQKSIQLPELT
ncbi:hypothetical protein NIES21_41420 [Anabaenopsis circularis NIES-21]|uniref:Uncharacterized protein n=1 Tax=Anabaenopsis circularis NIES-21 TaxID=1085406 RepID=A0A1Z4GLT1_9CYAN|nr:hypothetical protein NIES21_41420 [Anabaenopsis circularis NIES-21]